MHYSGHHALNTTTKPPVRGGFFVGFPMSLSLMNAETAIGSIGRLWASAPVTIGSLTLTGMEVPNLIRDGGTQQV
ncbi:hypothetical protein CFR80_16910, partial [Komagataeibacter oboediens]